MTATMKEPLAEAEPLHVTVARRLRGKMGEQRLSQDQVCKIVGWNRGYMHRRYVGETALDVNDLAALETVGISTLYLLTGATEYPVAPHPFGAVSGDSSSNPSEAVAGAAMALPDPIEYLRNRVRMTTTTTPRAAGAGPRHNSLLPCADSAQQRLRLPWEDSDLQPFGLKPHRNGPRTMRCLGC
jgi:hypothetical protein